MPSQRIKKAFIAIACIAASATTASAERCPVAADMNGAGVVVTFADDSVVTYTRSGDTVLEVSRFADASRDFWLESHRGVFPVADGQMRGDEPDRRYVVQSSYPVPLSDLPKLERGLVWSGNLKEIDSSGVELGQSSLTVKVGGLRPKTVGGCDFPALPVETLFTGPDGGYQATVDYIPELGIGVQTAGGPLNTLLDFYRPVEIRPVAP